MKLRDLALLLSASTLLLAGCDFGTIGEAKGAVRHEMLDPDAAQFRNVRRCDGDREMVMGEVNGKNAYGAYTGFKNFIYGAPHVSFLSDTDYIGYLGRCYGPEIMRKAEAAADEATNAALEAAAVATAAAAVK